MKPIVAKDAPAGDGEPFASDLALANQNGAVWSIGNAMVSTTLVTSLAERFGASGASVSWILAAPMLIGSLRLFTPAISRVFQPRGRMVMTLFVASCLVLASLPLATFCWDDASPTGTSNSLRYVIVTWGVWHLLLYIAVVGLMAWLRDLMPPGRLGLWLGRRERWMVVGTIVGSVIALVISLALAPANRTQRTILPQIVSAELGVLLMLGSIVPLALMRDPQSKSPRGETWTIAAPSTTAAWHVIAFNVCFSLVNGLTGAAVGLFPYRVLGTTFQIVLGAQTVMRIGQAWLDPQFGALADRRGSAFSMTIGQALAALGLACLPLGWLIAAAFGGETAPRQFPIAISILMAAHLCWIGYGGLNVALPKAMFVSVPREETLRAVAWTHALSGLGYAAGSLAGGWLLDDMIKRFTTADLPKAYLMVLAIGVVGRVLLIFWAARLPRESPDFDPVPENA